MKVLKWLLILIVATFALNFFYIVGCNSKIETKNDILKDVSLVVDVENENNQLSVSFLIVNNSAKDFFNPKIKCVQDSETVGVEQNSKVLELKDVLVQSGERFRTESFNIGRALPNVDTVACEIIDISAGIE